MLSPGIYFSPGKLLITGEYLVLHGAMALAVPTRFGQNLHLEKLDSDIISWELKNHLGQITYSSEWNRALVCIHSNLPEWDIQVKRILEYLIGQGIEVEGFKFNFQLDYPQEWGLGSSATLIANLAKAASIDPMPFFRATQTGSGYDVAVAFECKSLIYKLESGDPIWEPVIYSPSFSKQMHFVFRGQKQKSDLEVKRYLKREKASREVLKAINRLTQQIKDCSELGEMIKLIRLHEELVGEQIGAVTVQKELFNDFNGVVKSLGAWGGDLMLAVAEEGQDVQGYFSEKGFPLALSYDEMIGEYGIE
jgi:mevalonate kinase